MVLFEDCTVSVAEWCSTVMVVPLSVVATSVQRGGKMKYSGANESRNSHYTGQKRSPLFFYPPLFCPLAKRCFRGSLHLKFALAKPRTDEIIEALFMGAKNSSMQDVEALQRLHNSWGILLTTPILWGKVLLRNESSLFSIWILGFNKNKYNFDRIKS